jgi:hypothetical protein
LTYGYGGIKFIQEKTLSWFISVTKEDEGLLKEYYKIFQLCPVRFLQMLNGKVVKKFMVVAFFA